MRFEEAANLSKAASSEIAVRGSDTPVVNQSIKKEPLQPLFKLLQGTDACRIEVRDTRGYSIDRIRVVGGLFEKVVFKEAFGRSGFMIQMEELVEVRQCDGLLGASWIRRSIRWTSGLCKNEASWLKAPGKNLSRTSKKRA